MERILVNLNPSRGLAKKVNLEYKEFFFEQILDYEYFPFRCHRFHVYGHLAKECPIGRRRKRFQRTSAQFEKTVHQNVTFHLKEAIAQQTEEEMETDPNRGQTLNVATQDLQFNRAGKEPELEDAIASMEITVPPPQIPLESEGAKGT